MNNLVEANSNQLASVDRMIEIAITSDVDVSKLEKLMDLKERYDNQEAKKAFNNALSEFQSICPVITKDRQGHNYRYASLPAIAAQIKEPLKKCGLNYRFEQTKQGDEIRVACIVTHLSGHSERTEMAAEADASGSKNAVQAIGSSNSYLQRYTLIGALGLTSADEDDDAARANEINIVDVLSHVESVRDLFESVSTIQLGILMDTEESLTEASNAWFELDNEEKQKLWRAPSKGGIFTTAERAKLQDSDLRKLTYPDS